ncbi:S-norcoclaurine synthase 1 [Dendrobium catenatum]|uniref:S-norcoclaurine synthase 1 n=1 Tax=Dendrobium catenatum TaxID=906689 RepID=UPI0009F166AB|nr:S-norcoclaurine synthase 1 [Dendrobium catenatum]
MNPKSTSPLELGGSLPVPNVQKLARSGEIPERYLRPEEDHAGHVITVDDLELPLVNHGIPEELIEKTKDDIMKFFKLPIKEKEVVKQRPVHIED